MFKVLIQLLLLTYVIIMISYLLELKKYNLNGFIVDCKDDDDISNNIDKLNPLYFKIPYNHTVDISDTEIFFKNEDQLKEINFDYSPIKVLLADKYLFYNNSITTLKNDDIFKLTCNFHNFNILSILSGECKIYLINPKHKKEIIDKENKEIKKWAHIKKLEKYDNILIPTNWYYFIETDDKLIIHHLDIDNYFTIIPNFFKNKLL